MRTLNEVFRHLYPKCETLNQKGEFASPFYCLEAYKYFIPLTSRKPKFAFLRQTGSDYFLIFEKVKEKNNNPKEIYREYERNKFIRIFAVLDLKRMIPVPDGVYRRVDFSKETDIRYKSLLVKEYQFCQHIKDAILTKTEKIYSEQKHSGKIHKGYCNFAKLEKACDGYFVVES